MVLGREGSGELSRFPSNRCTSFKQCNKQHVCIEFINYLLLIYCLLPLMARERTERSGAYLKDCQCSAEGQAAAKALASMFAQLIKDCFLSALDFWLLS